jgi:hypothetical protein
MITNKFTFYFGVILILILSLGIPVTWKFVGVVLVAVVLMVFSLKIDLPKSIYKKPVINNKKPETVENVPLENTYTPPVYTPPTHITSIPVHEEHLGPVTIKKVRKPRAVSKIKNTDVQEQS